MEHAKIETDSIVNPSSAVGCIQIVPKYISEAKMNRGQSPNILSEIFDLNENEGRGGTLAGIETLPPHQEELQENPEGHCCYQELGKINI